MPCEDRMHFVGDARSHLFVNALIDQRACSSHMLLKLQTAAALIHKHATKTCYLHTKHTHTHKPAAVLHGLYDALHVRVCNGQLVQRITHG
jgi:hypothetical protein